MELEVLVPDLLEEEPRTGVLSNKSRLRQVEEKEVVQVAAGKKKQKPRVKSQYEVTPISTCLRLCNNSIATVDGLNQAVDEMFDHPDKISWLDLSFNMLTTIEAPILTHLNLKSLALQGNQIKSVKEILKLRTLPHLKALAMHGNPLEESKKPPYRVFTTGALSSLVKLDFCAITA